MTNIDKRIINYVEIFFENIPYSESNSKIKTKILEKLQLELDDVKDFEKIIEKYNTLEKLCLLINCKKDKLKQMDNLITPDVLKKQFKKNRIKTYFISIYLVVCLAYIFNLFLNFNVTFIILAIIFGFLFITRLIRFIKSIEKNKFYSLEAYNFLKENHDKYLKKCYNTFFIYSIFITFCLINILILSVNSKANEVLESVNSMIFYNDIILILLTKNYLLINWINKCLGIEKVKKFNNHSMKIFVFSLIYWIIYLVLCFILKNNVINMFLIFIIIYSILILIYNLKYRKNITYKNIVINKKRIAFYSFLALVVFTYFFMQRDFWVLQPYINNVSNIGNQNSTITYNEENGIYTIIDNDDEDFKILQLTDIHLGGSIFSYDKDIKALNAVYNLLDYTKPDLVVVTGDMTFPLGLFSFSLNNHTPVMEFASFMRNTGIPWAFTYGNHDTENIATYSKEDLDLLYQTLSYKTSKNLLYPYTQPKITGRNNQLIEIRNTNGNLKQALFLIDSNAYTGEGFNKYDYIHDDQVDWYKEQILRLESEEKQNISSMVFFHIPLQEYKTAYQLYESGSDEVKYYFGANEEEMFDKVCSSDYPSKIFDTALELNSTKAFFCGHDHYNNMSLEYKGIRLTYGMSIDYLAMPGISKDTKQRGATLITVHEDSSYDIEQIPLESLQK